MRDIVPVGGDVDGCGNVVFPPGSGCVGGGAVNVNVGAGVLVAVDVGETGIIGVKDGIAVSSCEDG